MKTEARHRHGHKSKDRYRCLLSMAASALVLGPFGWAQGLPGNAAPRPFSGTNQSTATPMTTPTMNPTMTPAANHAAADPAARRPSSMLDQSATPAVVELSAGKLTIHATNSSLRAILGEMQTRIGTQVEGLTRDERVYGVYGPGDPQSVLASLLDDSGYNVLIAGRRPDGAPRQVVLSPRSVVTPLQAQAAPRTQAAEEEDDSSDAPEPQQVPTPPPAAPAAPGANPAIKTPQQMLEELQRLRQNALGQAPPQ